MRIRATTQKRIDQILILLKQNRTLWLPMPRVYRTAIRILERRGVVEVREGAPRPNSRTIVRAYRLHEGAAA